MFQKGNKYGNNVNFVHLKAFEYLFIYKKYTNQKYFMTYFLCNI